MPRQREKPGHLPLCVICNANPMVMPPDSPAVAAVLPPAVVIAVVMPICGVTHIRSMLIVAHVVVLHRFVVVHLAEPQPSGRTAEVIGTLRFAM